MSATPPSFTTSAVRPVILGTTQAAADEIFHPGRHLLHTESRDGAGPSRRPARNDDRPCRPERPCHSLLPNLMAAAPKYAPRRGPGERVTLTDINQYVEENVRSRLGLGSGPDVPNCTLTSSVYRHRKRSWNALCGLASRGWY